jgi:hypothetical protein
MKSEKRPERKEKSTRKKIQHTDRRKIRSCENCKKRRKEEKPAWDKGTRYVQTEI